MVVGTIGILVVLRVGATTGTMAELVTMLEVEDVVVGLAGGLEVVELVVVGKGVVGGAFDVVGFVTTGGGGAD